MLGPSGPVDDRSKVVCRAFRATDVKPGGNPQELKLGWGGPSENPGLELTEDGRLYVRQHGYYRLTSWIQPKEAVPEAIYQQPQLGLSIQVIRGAGAVLPLAATGQSDIIGSTGPKKVIARWSVNCMVFLRESDQITVTAVNVDNPALPPITLSEQSTLWVMRV